MKQKIVQIDAFADRPFAGNPAAVCIMESAADESWMQNVAREMNLSETAFLYPIKSGYHLRWFTPAVEVELCGHATLASAYLLYADQHVPSDQVIHFKTLSGELTAQRNGDYIVLDFPAKPPEQCDTLPGLEQSLGVAPIWCGMSKFDLLVEVESEKIVHELAPDIGGLANVKARGVIVTARGDDKYDCVSRFFAPNAGVAEDPVTGSAHCVLAPYWAGKLGKNELLGYQASQRGGEVRMHLQGDRVHLSGRAVVTMRGELE